MFSISSLAILGLVNYASAHMIMSSPAPFSNGLNNSPLLATGADFPCKKRTNSAGTTDVTYDATGIPGGTNAMALGSTQSLAFIGSATHGGGSCQVSITYDLKPSASSVWKVIHSIEGGCPARNQAGNLGDNANMVDPDTYSFQIPTTLPTGNATLAWTWFNKVGNREMYMNCAPVTFSATTTKRAIEIKRDTAAFNALPNMFTANIGNGCTTADSKDVLFPNPGDSVEQLGGSTKAAALASATGSGCAAAVAGQSGAASTGSPSSAAAANPTPTTVASVPATSKAALGGVFATVAPSSAVVVTASPVKATTLVPAVSSVAPVVPAASPVSSSPAVVASAASPASTGSASGTMTGACTTEGMWNCIGGSSFQRCASGLWSVVQPMAAGTSCGTSGQVTNINIIAIPVTKPRKRSSPHIRKHIKHASH